MTTRGPPESPLQGTPGGAPSVTLPQTHTWGLEGIEQVKFFSCIQISDPDSLHRAVCLFIIYLVNVVTCHTCPLSSGYK